MVRSANAKNETAVKAKIEFMELFLFSSNAVLLLSVL